MDRILYRTYVDETGDRGTSRKSSPFFTMAAVTLRDEYCDRIDDVLDTIADAGDRAPGSIVHWRDLKHLQRRKATELIADLPIRIVYVIVPKATVKRTAHIATHHGAFYNFAARLVLERVSWLVNDAGGRSVVTFERVRGFPPSETTRYVDWLYDHRNDPAQSIRWAALSRKVRIDAPARVRALCLADIAAGAIDSAMRYDPSTGLLEPAYLFTISGAVYRGARDNQVLRCGMKLLAPNDDALTTLPWWPGPFA